MSFTGKTQNEPDGGTLALWEAAEAGQLGQVEAMLPRVADINARNEHGVTALMRAAQHGHAKVVRLLLAHGADANIVRNDKFTALSLAAFFGHTEVVRILMEHGADSKVSTRQGTSAHMWATARTFSEVVNQLEKPAPPKLEEPKVTKPAARAASVPAPPTPAPGKVTSAIVRTLKDPPEIWDLVHEVPKGFDARKAFLGHLRSMRLTLRLATGIGLIAVCVVGALVLRGVHARSEVTLQQQTKPASPAVELQRENTTIEGHSDRPHAAAPAPAPDFVAPVLPLAKPESGSTQTRRRSSHSRVARLPEVEFSPAQRVAVDENVKKMEVSAEKSDAKVRPQSTPVTKSSSPLSPQLIAPAKNATAKTKVIQWP